MISLGVVTLFTTIMVPVYGLLLITMRKLGEVTAKVDILVTFCPECNV